MPYCFLEVQSVQSVLSFEFTGFLGLISAWIKDCEGYWPYSLLLVVLGSF